MQIRNILSIAATMMLATSLSTAIAAPRSGAAPVAHQVKPALALKAVKVKKNYVVSDISGPSLVAGFNDIASANVTCGGTKPCTLVISAMDQLGVCSASGQWAISVRVDGTFVDIAPYQGQQPTSGYAVGNWQGYFATTPGNHVVLLQTYIAPSTTCSQGSYALNTGVATP